MKTSYNFSIARKLSIVLVNLFVAILLAGCGEQTVPQTAINIAPSASTSPASAGGGMVEITFPMLILPTEPSDGWLTEVESANKLLAAKNIKINVDSFKGSSWSDYYQKITARITSGQVPDIGRVAESLLPEFIKDNSLIDLTDSVKELDMSKYFDKAFQNAGFQGGKNYGIPSGIYYMLLYYNKDMFDKAGVKHPSTDWDNSITFDQVTSYAKKFTQVIEGDKTFGFGAGPYTAFIGMYSASNGGKNVFNADGTCALNDPVSKGVYSWFDNMLHADKSMPGPDDSKIMSNFDRFKAGKLAMLVDGTWSQQPIKNEVKNFKVGIAAIPSGKGKSASSMFVDSWVVWKGTKHEKEAREALKALASVEAVSALAATGVGGLPIRRDVLDNLKDQLIGVQFTAEDKATFINGLSHTLAVPYNQHYQEIDDKINASMDNWLKGSMSSDQFANRSCDIMTSVLKQ